MNKEQIEFKQKVYKAGVDKQSQLIMDFEESINEIRSSEDNINDSQYDLQQAGANEEMEDRIEQLAAQRNFALEEMETLKKLNPEGSTPQAHFGSIVETDKLSFFISVSLEKLEVDGKVIYGISRKAPIYKVMEGKSKGDTFEYNGTKYKIKDVY